MNKYTIVPYLIRRTPSYSKLEYSIDNLDIYLQDTYFLHALELASPVFFSIIRKKLDSGQPLSKKENLTLKKYVNRIHFRSTPFGLFSHVGISAWQKPDQNIPAHYKEELNAFYRPKEKDTETGENCYINESTYKVDKEIRYLKQEADKNKSLEWKVFSVRSSNLLNKLISYCANGRPRPKMVEYIMEQQQVPASEAASFIDELFDTQLLYPEHLQGPVKKAFFYRQVVIDIEEKKMSAQLIKREILNDSGSVNLFDNHTDHLNTIYMNNIQEAIDCLNILSSRKENQRFNNFINKFNHKYDRKPVQLLRALDPEIGIAYIEHHNPNALNSVIKDMNFKQERPIATPIDWGIHHRLLLRKIQEAGPSEPIEISDKDLHQLRQDKSGKSLSTSLSVMFRFSQEEEIIIENVGGVSALALLGRFTENPRIDTLVKDMALKEISINPDVIFAEINSPVSARHLNINLRTNPYTYEICIGIPCVNPYQIPINDLFLFQSQDQLILYSKRLKKRIIPRLSTAYNYDIDSLPVFQFLCDLQYQGLHYDLGLDLQEYFPGLNFYPRVTYKQTILQLAVWYLNTELLQGIKNATLESAIEQFDIYCKRKHIPQKVALIEHDKFLVFNLANVSEKEFLIECIKGMEEVKLQEHLYGIGDFHQQYKQYIASVINNDQVYRDIAFPNVRAKKINDYILPNEWLYFKIYCHPVRSEELLHKIGSIIKTLFETKELKQWFYINYSDPEYHLRLRLKLDKQVITSRVQQQVNLLYDLHLKGYIHRIDIDTYQPEYERYGVKLMDYAEAIFHRDSEYCLSLIRDKGNLEADYFHQVILSIHKIFESLQLKIKDRGTILHSLSEHLIDEINISKYELDKSYRKHAADIEAVLLINEVESPSSIHKQRFDLVLCKYFEKVKTQEVAEKLSNILHMHINRLFTTTAKIHEATIYYWLYKYYKSLSRKTTPNKAELKIME